MGGLPPEFITKIADYCYYGTLGLFSALVGYLVRVVKSDEPVIHWPTLFVTLVVGLYMGVLFGGLMPADWGDKRDAVMLLIGASGIKGFDLISALSLDKIKNLMK